MSDLFMGSMALGFFFIMGIAITYDFHRTVKKANQHPDNIACDAREVSKCQII